LLTGIRRQLSRCRLSRFQPATVFKTKGGVGGRNRFTQALVVLQYVLAIVLLVATGVISQQLAYLRAKDLGYNQEQVVIVSVPGETFSERFKTRLAQYDKIISAGGSDRSFTSGWQTRDIRNDQGGWQEIRLIRIDSDYLKTLGIELIAGRNFSASHPSDTMEAVIVNETFVNTLGWIDPLGKRLEDLKTRDDRQPPAIIGVVKDFHIDGLQKKIEPLVLHMNPDRHGIYNVFVRLRP
jgi:putative ABC transport system permease protein